MTNLTTSSKYFASLDRAPGATWTEATIIDGLFRVMQSGEGREVLLS